VLVPARDEAELLPATLPTPLEQPYPGRLRVVFTDAVITHPPDGMAGLVAATLADDRDLVSLMARLRVATGWKRLLVPAFVYFFTLSRSLAGSTGRRERARRLVLASPSAASRLGGLHRPRRGRRIAAWCICAATSSPRR
jgi:hypothetical protein